MIPAQKGRTSNKSEKMCNSMKERKKTNKQEGKEGKGEVLITKGIPRSCFLKGCAESDVSTSDVPIPP